MAPRSLFNDLFYRNRSSSIVEEALRELENSDLIVRRKGHGSGKSTEIIYLKGTTLTTLTTNDHVPGIERDVEMSFMSSIRFESFVRLELRRLSLRQCSCYVGLSTNV
jgi:hypothetical protein